MKQFLLPKYGQFYKSNLHCHTTLSDGKCTPEEVKEIYKNLGYSVVAYTDHNLFVPHNELTDEKFLALNGMELDVSEEDDKPWYVKKTCHICYIALDKDNEIQPMWNDADVYWNPQNKSLVKYDESLPPYIKKYSGEGISEMMRIGREKGFFVTYNHPTWSFESYPEYIEYNHMHALEMFNGGCIVGGYEDYNPRVYDDFLNAGKKIYCVGGDDNHEYHDMGIAYTMIKSEKLDYKSITDALLKGDFYCSEGPSIYSLWIDDDKVHIECSDAEKIILTSMSRKGKRVAYAENNEALTSASFDIGEENVYVRITVVDKQGKHACTNAYFID